MIMHEEFTVSSVIEPTLQGCNFVTDFLGQNSFVRQFHSIENGSKNQFNVILIIIFSNTYQFSLSHYSHTCKHFPFYPTLCVLLVS